MSEFVWPPFNTPAACRPLMVAITLGIACAGVSTTSVRVVVLVPPIEGRESVPVTVSVKVPAGAFAVVMVSVDEKPAAFPLAGLKLAVAPAGRPEADREMVGRPEVADPETSDSVIAYVLEPVVNTWRLDGLPATLKS